MAFKKYKSHKIVDADKIVSFVRQYLNPHGEKEEVRYLLTAEDGTRYEQRRSLFARGEPQDDYFYLVRYKGGYISWSPKEAFEDGYSLFEPAGYAFNSLKRPAHDLDFGGAIFAMKQGLKAARAGWNGKDMFIYYVPAASYPASRNKKGIMTGMFPNDLVPYREYLALKTAQGDVVTWSPSVSDALANDWFVVE